MKERELEALIRLLDDEDPEVSHHVQDKLLSLGADVLPRLEAAWEHSPDVLVQDRLVHIIHRIHTRDAWAGMLNWLQDEKHSLPEGWYALGRFMYPNLPGMNSVRRQISRMLSRYQAGLHGDMNLVERIMALNQFFFTKEQFEPETRHTGNPDLYFLTDFFERKKGAAIPLTLLYYILAQEAGLEVEAILLPGYMLLRLNEGGKEYYLDVFSRGQFCVAADIDRFLEKSGAAPSPANFIPATHTQLLAALAWEIEKMFHQRKDPQRAEIFGEVARCIEKAA